MSNKTAKLPDSAAKRLVPFNSFPPELRYALIKQAEILQKEDGDYLFRQGDEDNSATYLLEGEVRLFSGMELIDTVQGSGKKAHHPLSPILPRELSAKIHGGAKVFRIDNTLLDICLIWTQTVMDKSGGGSTQNESEWVVRLACSGLFRHVPATNAEKIFTRLQSVKVRAGDTVIRQGEEGDYYYVIREGRCAVTRRLQKQERSIQLAELRAGDSFGEEALITQCRRNATITMQSDGILERLTKEDFIALVKDPMLNTVDRKEAEEMVQEGAIWLDVRLPDEYHCSHLDGSINLPLATLRTKSKKLLPDRRYIAYCNSGRRASVAAFLLTERGFDISYLPDGIMAPKPAPRPTAAGKKATLSAGKAEAASSQVAMRLAKAKHKVEAALLRKAEADAAVLAAETETERLQKIDDTKVNSFRKDLESRLTKERQQFLQEAKQAEKALKKANAARLKLEAAKQSAEDTAAKRLGAVEQAHQEKNRKAELRLVDAEQRLGKAYNKACETLEAIQRIRNNTESELSVQRDSLDEELRLVNMRVEDLEQALAKARRLKQGVEKKLSGFETRANAKREELVERERHESSKAEMQLREERDRLERVFADNLQLHEVVRREQKRVEEVRRAARQEKEEVTSRIREERSQMREKVSERLLAEQQRLAQETIAAAKQIEDAGNKKQKAESRLQSLRAELDQQLADGADGDELLREAKRHEEKVAKAGRELDNAYKTQINLELSRRIVEVTDNGLDNTENRLRKKLETELDEWLQEDDEEGKIREQKTIQIKRRLVNASQAKQAAKQAEEQAVDDMFSEIQNQLGEDG